MIIEGRNAVREALRNQSTIDKLLVAKGGGEGSLGSLVAMARDRGIRISFVEKEVLDHTSVTGHHQGVIAYVTDFRYCSLQDVLDAKRGCHHFILVLDGIEDPHNFGSIVRVAECMGVDGIVIAQRRQVPVNETVIRASCGATEYMPIAKVGNINDAIRTLRDNFVSVYALDMSGTPLSQTRLTGDIALVVGNEGKGVKSLTKQLCDGSVAIPMYGHIESLNASVACGVALYAAVCQRQ